MSPLRRIASRAVDLLYPPSCPGCHGRMPAGDARVPVTDGAIFCPPCTEDVRPVTEPRCGVCGEGFPEGSGREFRCPNCHDRTFAFAFAIAAFENRGPVRELVHRFKYGRQLYLRQPLAGLLAHGLGSPRLAAGDDGAGGDASPWVLVPVPLHHSRRRRRGFNQAEELCRLLERSSGLRQVRALRRTRATTPQARLDRHERLRNLQGAFALRGNPAISGERVLLIDDVFTTGATADACARILTRDGGARKVAVLTVARG